MTCPSNCHEGLIFLGRGMGHGVCSDCDAGRRLTSMLRAIATGKPVTLHGKSTNRDGVLTASEAPKPDCCRCGKPHADHPHKRCPAGYAPSAARPSITEFAEALTQFQIAVERLERRRNDIYDTSAERAGAMNAADTAVSATGDRLLDLFRRAVTR